MIECKYNFHSDILQILNSDQEIPSLGSQLTSKFCLVLLLVVQHFEKNISSERSIFLLTLSVGKISVPESRKKAECTLKLCSNVYFIVNLPQMLSNKSCSRNRTYTFCGAMNRYSICQNAYSKSICRNLKMRRRYFCRLAPAVCRACCRGDGGPFKDCPRLPVGSGERGGVVAGEYCV